jgi:hypothetical protein
MRIVMEVSNVRQLAARAGLTLTELGRRFHCHHSLVSQKLSGHRVWYGPEVKIFHSALRASGVLISLDDLRNLIGVDNIYDSGRWVRPERMKTLEKELNHGN